VVVGEEKSEGLDGLKGLVEVRLCRENGWM
jgi:hypothetical protein